MKKICYILPVILMMMFMTACEVDNYDLPDAGLQGTVTDAVTGKGVITEQPGGFNIYLREIDEKYPNAPNRSFQVKPDGTFTNTKVFAATYDVWPVNGPFVPLTESQRQRVTLSSNQLTSVNFTVTPYVSFESVSITKTGADEATISFILHKNAGTIQDYRVFATNRTPLVGTQATDNVGGNAVTVAESDLGHLITVTRSGFEAGTKYWLRLGARCAESPSTRYNLTEVVELHF
jgi:hypothetical protein